MLIAKDVSVLKKGKKILSDISLNIQPGEINCVVGRNGAGKSTLLRTLVGLESLLTGTVSYDGVDMLSSNRYYALWELGIMLSSNSFYGYLTCAQNLEIIQRYYGQTRFTIDEIIDLFHLVEYRNQKVYQLSSGTKQRLSLALSFINCPSLVILDEPFNSIDRENTKQIVKLIQQLNQTYNTAFLITSHSFDDVEILYSTLSILKKGQLINQTTRSVLEKLTFVRLRETALTITFEELNNLFPNAKRDDEFILLTTSSEQDVIGLVSTPTAIELQRKATPKDFYELFG